MRSASWLFTLLAVSCGAPRREPGTPVQIEATAGDEQTAVAGSTLPAPFVATVKDVFGTPVPGVAVSFVVYEGGGTISAASVTTDAQGQAQTTSTLGPCACANAVWATIGAPTCPEPSMAIFGAEGVAGSASQLVLSSGNNQGAMPDTTLGAPLVVTVEDINGNPVSGSTVTFAVTAGGGTVSASGVTTDAKGQAQTSWTVGSDGPSTVVAQASGLAASPIVFTAWLIGIDANIELATGSEPTSVAVGDVNGDGKPDLAVTNAGSNTVSVLLNTAAAGAAAPSFAAPVDFATGPEPVSVAIADVNGDGKPDLMVAGFGSNTVAVLLNTTATGATAPSFAAGVDFVTDAWPESIAVADINGDGKPDLVVVTGSDAVSVLLNTTATGAATPSLAPNADFATPSPSSAIAVADINRDGKPDLVIGVPDEAEVLVLLNTTATGATTPSFATSVAIGTQAQPWSLAVGDLNGDGTPDLAVHGAITSVLLNTTATGATTPSFASPATVMTGSDLGAIAIGDVNSDGKPDLVVTNGGSYAYDVQTGGDNVSVLLNVTTTGASTASFAPAVDYTTGLGPVAVAISDLNGDGEPDLVVPCSEANQVSVLFAPN